MDNFDLKQFLVENKLTENSRLIKEDEKKSEIELAFENSPNELSFEEIEQIFKESGDTGEEFFAGVEDEFREEFKDKPVITKNEYVNFFIGLPTTAGLDDLYAKVNWIGLTNPTLADELYNKI